MKDVTQSGYDPLIEAILDDEPTVITRNGEKVAVIVPVAIYKRLMAALAAPEQNGSGGGHDGE